jgi:hypothetical protein
MSDDHDDDASGAERFSILQSSPLSSLMTLD